MYKLKTIQLHVKPPLHSSPSAPNHVSLKAVNNNKCSHLTVLLSGNQVGYLVTKQ